MRVAIGFGGAASGRSGDFEKAVEFVVEAERLGVDIVKGTTGGDPAAVAFDAADAVLARGTDVLLVDTAGRLHTQQNLMRQLTKTCLER